MEAPQKFATNESGQGGGPTEVTPAPDFALNLGVCHDLPVLTLKLIGSLKGVLNGITMHTAHLEYEPLTLLLALHRPHVIARLLCGNRTSSPVSLLHPRPAA
ncbi:hypothetical protein [Deinococcus sp. QL22]|uniref:hypothetical protein n=1 Tax=Deinococcus sp. QL22 TaxID=2939437 RepID=UPI0020177AB5|nr:hypothetical protein [Deinococcus sp. QL22]UQN07355.1 hypothetical protein M1R55_05505 [Deinococcus sp. QL22]